LTGSWPWALADTVSDDVGPEKSHPCFPQVETLLGLGRVDELALAGEDAYREAGLDAGSTDDALLDAMARHPVLIERPILILSRRAAVGPLENIETLLLET
jgi:arsenate reductase